MPGVELFGAEERKEVNDVLETGILFRYNHDNERKGIWKAKELEQSIEDFTGAKHCHFVSSGTAAVYSAMAACGIGYGDEVIVPPYTFLATIEAVMFAGGVPVFAEIDDTICLNPDSIRKAITPKTKAICLVHMCGAIGHIEEILQICKEHNLILIEDSAQALGATYKGQHAGTFGKVGCYSFDFFKIVTSGEGGAIVTNDDQIYKNVDTFTDHGHDHIGPLRGMEQHPNVGLNFRTSELHAAVGLAQMKKLDRILTAQRKNHAKIKAVLEEFPQIKLRNIPEPAGDSCTFICFFGPDEATTRNIVKALAAEGVDSCAYWYDNMYHFIKNWDHIHALKSVNTLPVHVLPKPQDYSNVSLPMSYDTVSRLISMTIKVTWSEEDLAKRVENIRKALKSIFN
ncbi:MAG: DegT/DnrJ/EryC1/StrS family aminotransferase [Cytophagales bacterium]